MEHDKAVTALQALAHPHRLKAFRVLVRWGELGLSAGQIADALGIPPSSLSFHLGRLERAGLIRPRRTGRRLIYAVAGDGVRALLEYLTEDCCHGHPALCGHPERERSIDMAEGDNQKNVLFLCTGNSARSIIAECILNRLGMGRFRAFSAGSEPKGEVHPFALQLLRSTRHDVSALRSKSWEEFAQPGAPALELVFTVCDRAAAESCPVWPGQPITAHWGIPDPAAVRGKDAEVAAAFANAYRVLENRIGMLVSLPVGSLNRVALQRRLDQIGRGEVAVARETGSA